jgi:hypothetical protein
MIFNYYESIKEKFIRFFDKFIINGSINCDNKFKLEQEFLENMIIDIEKDLENDKNNPDVLRALDYINSQKSTSISLYQT